MERSHLQNDKMIQADIGIKLNSINPKKFGLRNRKPAIASRSLIFIIGGDSFR